MFCKYKKSLKFIQIIFLIRTQFKKLEHFKNYENFFLNDTQVIIRIFNWWHKK